MSIQNCPRCKLKYIDTLEEILCDSCADIMAEPNAEDMEGVETTESKVFAENY